MKKSLFVLLTAMVTVFEISTVKATSAYYPRCVYDWAKHPMVKAMPKELLCHAEYFQKNILEMKPNNNYERTIKQRLVKAGTIELVKKMPSQWLSKNPLDYFYFIYLLRTVRHSDEKNYNGYAKKIVEIIKMKTQRFSWHNKKKQSTALVIKTPSIVECMFEQLYNDQTQLYKNVFTERKTDVFNLMLRDFKVRYTIPFALPVINFYINKQSLQKFPKIEI